MAPVKMSLTPLLFRASGLKLRGWEDWRDEEEIHSLPSSLKTSVGFRRDSSGTEVHDSFCGSQILVFAPRDVPHAFSCFPWGPHQQWGTRPSYASNHPSFSYCHITLIPATESSLLLRTVVKNQIHSPFRVRNLNYIRKVPFIM